MNELEKSTELHEKRSLVVLKIANILYDYIDWSDDKNGEITNLVFSEVFDLYLESNKLDYTNIFSYLGLINLNRKKKDYAESIKCIDKAIFYMEDEYRIYFEGALTYYEMKCYEKTVEFLELCIMYNNRCSDAYHLLGNIMFEKNRTGKAFEYYEYSLIIKPNIEIYNNIGDFYLSKVRKLKYFLFNL